MGAYKLLAMWMLTFLPMCETDCLECVNCESVTADDVIVTQANYISVTATTVLIETATEVHVQADTVHIGKATYVNIDDHE